MNALPSVGGAGLPGKPKLLIVDDDREIVLALSLRLRAAGYQVATADNGAKGLAAAIETIPDAIVLDIRMPVMDGLTVLSNLRKHEATKAIPVVMLSANVAEIARARALDLGARYFLEKPYDTVRLIETIVSVIGGKHCETVTTVNSNE